jgi:hypothetical protein
VKVIFLDFNGTIDKPFTSAYSDPETETQDDYLYPGEHREAEQLTAIFSEPELAVADHVDSCETCWDEGGRYGQCNGCPVEYHEIVRKISPRFMPEPDGPSPAELGEVPEAQAEPLGHPLEVLPSVTTDKGLDNGSENSGYSYAPELPGVFRAYDHEAEPVATKWGRNSGSSWVSSWGFQTYKDEPNPESVKYIKQLAENTGAKIVYSTTRRYSGWQSCADYLGLNYKYSLGHPLYGVTPSVPLYTAPKKKFFITWLKNIPLFKKQQDTPAVGWCKPRQQEIKRWLQLWQEAGGEKIESFVILDDDQITDPELVSHWVPSISRNRFLKDEYEEALKILKK